MNVKKTHFFFLAVLLVAMMSVTVAADVNDTSDSITTHSVTQYTANTVDMQTVNAEDNKINKKIDTNIKESTQDNPKTIIVQ